jgi:hypothetical protein
MFLQEKIASRPIMKVQPKGEETRVMSQQGTLLRMLPISVFIGSFALSMLVTGCGHPTSTQGPAFEPANQSESALYHPYDVNSFQLNKVVCDPMGGPGNPGPQDGLIAELFTVDHKMHRHTSVQDLIDQGAPSNQKLFFTDVNVPTRVFDTGFPTEAGTMIQDDQGQDLIEYFALRFKSVLKLGPDDQEGEYELALLADDGAILKVIDIDGAEQVIVDNDGVHPSRFGCGQQTLHMSRDTALDIRLDYFQGPRYHISLIPMWRKVDASTQPEKECGRQGNARYFAFNDNSKPKKKYLELLGRGWKPIGRENWELPISTIFNPCQDGTPATISDVGVEKQGETVLIVTWNTDRPATSQVLLRDSQGQETMTTADNVLRTQHRVIIDQGLRVGQVYTLQPVAITSDMGKTLGRVLQVTL